MSDFTREWAKAQIRNAERRSAAAKRIRQMAEDQKAGQVQRFEQRRAEVLAEGARLRQEQAADTLELYRARTLRGWLASGGDESDFEDAWPNLKDEWLKGQALASASRPLDLGVSVRL